MATLHEQRSQATRERLLAAAVALLDDKGIRDFSIHAVAREAGMTSGAVQHHFPSKADLMLAVLDHLVGGLEDDAGFWPSPRWSLRRRADHFVHAAWDRLYGRRRFQSAWSAYLAITGEPGMVERVRRERGRIGDRMQARLALAFPGLCAGRGGAARCQFVLSALRGLGLLQPFASPAQVDQQLQVLSQYIQSFPPPRQGDTP